MVLESDFVDTGKLSLYRQSLDEYLLQEYLEKFGLIEQTNDSNEELSERLEKRNQETKKDLFATFFPWGSKGKKKKQIIAEEETKKKEKTIGKAREIIEMKEDIWGHPLLSEEEQEENNK